MSLYEQARVVTSPEDLGAFARALSEDFVDRTSDSWENVTINAYLEAISGWFEDSAPSLNEQGLPPGAWQVVAQTLLMGKFYE